MEKPKLFFSYSHKDSELINEIRHILMERNFSILSDHQVNVGEDFSNSIIEQIKQADYFLLFLSEEYINSRTASSERNIILGYSQSNNSKYVLPILINHTELPSDISKLLYLDSVGHSASIIAEKIVRIVNNFEAQKVREKEIIAERVEKINLSISDHIEPIINDLNTREINFRKIANRWNFLGYVSILLGVLAAVTLVVIDTQFELTINLERIFYLGIKGTILLILLLTSSKYAFTLSKSYMNESLKVADRIHAISFGKFYIKAFEQSINTNDFKEIFQNWNVSKESSFSNISTDNYDPKITESFGKILDAIKEIRKN